MQDSFFIVCAICMNCYVYSVFMLCRSYLRIVAYTIAIMPVAHVAGHCANALPQKSVMAMSSTCTRALSMP